MAERSGRRAGAKARHRVRPNEENYGKLRANADEQAIKWRFHRAADQRWRWQKIAADQSIIAESQDSFATYLECVANAGSEGYEQPPTAEGLTEPL